MYLRKLFKLVTEKDMYKYQEDLFHEQSSRIIINKSRQIGITFFYAFYSLLFGLTGKKIIVISPSERQSLNFFEYVKKFYFNLVLAFHKAYIELENIEVDILQYGYMKFKNGGVIRSLPNSPDTIRGLTADIIILDEMAHFENGKEIWEATYPMVIRGERVVIISTPAGETGLFAEFWQNAEKYNFKKILINYRQCPDFNQQLIEQFRKSLDELSWRQEYENEFLGSSLSYFTLDVIDNATDIDLTYTDKPELLNEKLIFGVDVGRRVDKTAIVGINQKGEVKYIDTLDRVSYAEQFNYLKMLLPNTIEMRIDANGIGNVIAEELQKQSSVVKPIQITNEINTSGFVELRKLIEQKKIKLPKHDELRRALNLIERNQTGATIIFKAPRTDDVGHSDLAWALMLATSSGKTFKLPEVEFLDPKKLNGWLN